MHIKSLMLRTPDPDPNAGGGAAAPSAPPAAPAAPADWKEALPDPIKGDPILTDVPDLPTLAKNYIETKKFVGMKRLEAPDKNWDEKKWGDFFSALGRPDAPDKYQIPKVEIPEGMTVDESAIKAAKESLHKLGLTQKQFEGALSWYLGFEADQFKKSKTELETGRSAAETELRSQWGDKFEQNTEIARAALKKFASEDFAKFAEESGLGNNPEMVRVFHAIGSAMMEDTAIGKGPGLPLSQTTEAALELASLRLDSDFMQALTKREHVGHKSAVERWEMLHRRAYPGKQVK